MSRRPLLDLIRLDLRVPRSAQGLWSIILDLDRTGPWAAVDIDKRSNIDAGTVRDLIRRLVRAGYARVVCRERRGRSGTFVALYRLIEKPVDCPRIRRDGTRLGETQSDRLWRAMRMAKTFTADELSDFASTPDHVVDRLIARRYVRELAGVGVLGRIDAGGGRGKIARYRLRQDLGARAPKILRAHIVFDPNSNVVLGMAEASEVA